MATLQDFALVRKHVSNITKDKELNEDSLGFYFLILEQLLGLQEDEAEDSITDTFYLKKVGKPSGHDSGIDAIYIEDTIGEPTVHLFNFNLNPAIVFLSQCWHQRKIDNFILV